MLPQLSAVLVEGAGCQSRYPSFCPCLGNFLESILEQASIVSLMVGRLTKGMWASNSVNKSLLNSSHGHLEMTTKECITRPFLMSTDLQVVYEYQFIPGAPPCTQDCLVTFCLGVVWNGVLCSHIYQKIYRFLLPL